jgi:hypothetical protein
MRRRAFGVPLALALTLGACGSSGEPTARSEPSSTAAPVTTTTKPAGPTPFEVLDAENEAFNRGDVAGSIAYFAPNAVLITPLGGCNPCTGREIIREHWSGATANQTNITLSDPHTVGSIVTAKATVRSPQFPTGITRALGSAVVEVRNGKITRIDQRYDRTDPQTGALLAIVEGARDQSR